MRSNFYNLLIFLIIISFSVSCSNSKGGRKGDKKMPPPVVVVTTATKDSIANSMEFISETTSNYDVLIQPRVNGYLTSIEYRDGMPVKKGEILFRIDPSTIKSEIASARSEVGKAVAQLVEAKNNYQRAVPLAKIDAISQSMLDQYEAVYKSAKASLVAAEAQLTESELNMSYTTIYSPIDGIIGENDLAVGQYVGPSSDYSSLNTISNIDSINVIVSIPVSEYLKIVENSKLNHPSYDNSKLFSNIELYLSDGSLYPYKGSYLYTQKDVGRDMGTLEIVVTFPNREGLLKVGQFARIKTDIGSGIEAILVPQVCVNQSQGVNSVWIIDNEGRAQFKKVMLGKTHGKDWIVISGINEGDKVVSSGQMKLRKGELVRVESSKNEK